MYEAKTVLDTFAMDSLSFLLSQCFIFESRKEREYESALAIPATVVTVFVATSDMVLFEGTSNRAPHLASSLLAGVKR